MSACASTPASAAALIGALRKLQRASWLLFGRVTPATPHQPHSHHSVCSSPLASRESASTGAVAVAHHASRKVPEASVSAPSWAAAAAAAAAAPTTSTSAATAAAARSATAARAPLAFSPLTSTAVTAHRPCAQWRGGGMAVPPGAAAATASVPAAARALHSGSGNGNGDGGGGGRGGGGQDQWRRRGGAGRGGAHGGRGSGGGSAQAGRSGDGAGAGSGASAEAVGGVASSSSNSGSSTTSSAGGSSNDRSGGGGRRWGRDWSRGRSRGGGAAGSGGQEGGGGGGAGEARSPTGLTSSLAAGSPATPSPSSSQPSSPPPAPSSGPIDVRTFTNFSLLLYRLPPLRADRTPAEQRCLGAALSVVARLRSHGYTGMFAGGWVRDQYLGRPSADIDLATNATIVQICEVFGARQTKFRGGNTCDVTVDGIAFELTSYRGGLHDDCEEAEWRDAACRDFTINALFFEPKIPNHHLHQHLHQHQHQHQRRAANDGAAATANSSTSTITTASASGASTSWPPSPPPPASPLLPEPRFQPAGVVKDYVGGLVDLYTSQLRVFPNHTLLGNTASSVEMDPIRVLRAARLSVELRLSLDSHTEDRVRRAAAKCVLRQNGVTGSRVYRELAKMNDLDKSYSSSSSSNTSGGGGTGSGGPGIGGRPGSRLFAEALERCREWRALEALFPRLPQEHLQRVIRDVLPRLPADLPLELKLACLVVAPVGGGSELMPWNQIDKYEPITTLLEDTRQSAPGRHLPGLLCGLSDLLVSDFGATHRRGDWARLLATDGSDKVEVAMEAFMPRDWQRQLRERLAEHRTNLLGGGPAGPPPPPSSGGAAPQQQQQQQQLQLQQHQHQKQLSQQQQQHSGPGSIKSRNSSTTRGRR